MTFYDQLSNYSRDQVQLRINQTTPEQIDKSLTKQHLSVDDFIHLIAPQISDEQLERMAQRSYRITRQRFGSNILMYAPIYLSNECHNGCKYCGFSADNHLIRKTLTMPQIEKEAEYLNHQGFRHLLLLTGEAPEAAGVDYLKDAVKVVNKQSDSLSLEVFPMSKNDYQQMVNTGVDGLTLYQETYHQQLYKALHPYGPKSDYRFRLDAPERAAQAGMRRVGIGALLGLDYGLTDVFYTGLHALYLSRKYWRTQVSISFPRLRPAEGGFQPNSIITDRQLTQFICALRLLIPDAGLVLSTRESTELRNNLLPLGITQMSAGSSTAPGGYSVSADESEQFSINDKRSPAELSEYLKKSGYEVIWKDWDNAFLDQAG